MDALGELVTSTSRDSTSSPGLSQLESSLAEDSQPGPSQVRVRAVVNIRSFRVPNLSSGDSECHKCHLQVSGKLKTDLLSKLVPRKMEWSGWWI